MRIQDERFMLVIKALGIIEEKIKKEENPANIKNSVTMEMNYNERHFDRIFKSVIGCSLDEYIKDAAYIHAYESWRREKKKLSPREGYKGVPHFFSLLPVEMVKNTNWNELSMEKVFLICSSRTADGMQDHSISIPAEEMMIEYECLDYYDLENPELMNGNIRCNKWVWGIGCFT